MQQYNQVCFELSKTITRRYSTSFTIGIKTLHKQLRDPIYGIYGFVRLADEIVDTFHDFNKKSLLDNLRYETFKAFDNGISCNPVLQAFQLVVRKFNIDHDLVTDFLDSMEMDLNFKTYDEKNFNKYIYGSAEVVGLMCLHVFCNGDKEKYSVLKEPAQKLGSAFQKVNFLRDMNSDFKDRGRIYFPGVDFKLFDCNTKSKIEAEIEKDFLEAYHGVIALPEESKFGVYVAYSYYLSLLNKIKHASPDKIMNNRITVPANEKLTLLMKSFLKFQLNIL